MLPSLRPAPGLLRGRPAPELLQRTNRPIVPAVLACAIAGVFTLLRLAVAGHGNIASFILVERAFANPSLLPKGVPVLPANGYDGQFFYRLALNPSDLHREAYGITLDNTFRLQRIGYPVLAWLVSIGQHAWVPAALVVVNIVAIGALGFIGGLFARDCDRHAMWGLLLAGYFGFVFSLSRDTAEAVEAACMLAGLLAYQRGRPLVAAVLLAYGALTRETVLVAVGAIALARVIGILRRKLRPGLTDLSWLAPVAAFIAWQVVVRAVIGQFPISQDAQDNSGEPIVPMVNAIGTHARAALSLKAANDIWVVEFVVLAFFVIAAVTSIWSVGGWGSPAVVGARTGLKPAGLATVPPQELIAFGAYIIEALLLAPIVWNGVADLRSLDDVYVLAVIVLMRSRRRALWPMAVALVPVVALVAAHRIVSL